MCSKEKIRIGLLLENNEIPAWYHMMLSEIKISHYSDVILIIKKFPKEKENKRLFKNYKYFLYDLYCKLDRKKFKIAPDAFETKSVNSLLNIETVDEHDQDKIKKYNIDIIIYLGPDTLKGSILNSAKFGVWSFHFGNSKISRGNPDIFWEVIERKGEVGITLQMQLGNSHKILATSNSLTDNLSVARGRNSYFWKAASIIPRKINELYRLGENDFLVKVNKLNEHPNFYYNEIKSIPSNLKALVKITNFKLKRIRNILRSYLYYDQWILLFNFSESVNISTDISHFKKILPPKDRFWADPHIIKKNDIYYIFIEELIFTENKGFISVIEMDDKGNYKNPVKVLETDYHLSFPFIIEDKGSIYMIPESKQSNNIQLFKCIDFPYKWQLETILVDNIKAVDTIITFKNGKYWMFTNMIGNEGASFYDELFLFSSNTLVSNKWEPHPDNPIVSNVKNARMAGGLFSFNNNLYRPSQNCSNHYGYAIQINQILELNEENYKEKLIDSIYPNWDKKIRSTHSISTVENLTVIDAKIKRRK